MDTTKYNQIKDFLEKARYPSKFNNKQKKQLEAQSKFFIIYNHLLYKRDRRKKTQNQLLRVIREYEIETILHIFHDHPLGAHLGTEKMFEKIRSKYYWPQMYNQIRKYVQTCDQCQRRGKYRTPGPLQPIPIEAPFHKIGIDFVGPLPMTTKGNRYIVVSVDYMTKWPEAKAVPTADAQETAHFIFNEIVCRHGCPSYMISDRGLHFNNEVIRFLANNFGIKHIMSTPYHPQNNRLVERYNRTLCEALAKLTKQGQEWDTLIPSVLYAYRTSKQATTKFTPFYLVYGREARFPNFREENNINGNMVDRLTIFIEELPTRREVTKENCRHAQKRQKFYWDQKLKKVQRIFQKGDKVLLYDAAQVGRHTGKFLPRWIGPFIIHTRVAPDVYKLRTIDNQVLDVPQNAYLLKKYYDRNG